MKQKKKSICLQKVQLKLYVRDFTYEMNNSKPFIRAYNRLKEHLDAGKDIILICYCEDCRRCHRRLIADKLKEDGYDVILR